MKFSGIDLHSNNSVVVVSDEEDRIVYQKRLPNDLEQIRAALAPYREELSGVVVESTYNWYFLVDGLMDAGYRVHLANTTAIKKYEGLKYSGDFADAAYLAQLLRLGLLPEGYIYPREVPLRSAARQGPLRIGELPLGIGSHSSLDDPPRSSPSLKAAIQRSSVTLP